MASSVKRDSGTRYLPDPFLLRGRPLDVRKLLPEGLLDDARAAEVAKAYNAKEGVIVEVRNGRRTLV